MARQGLSTDGRGQKQIWILFLCAPLSEMGTRDPREEKMSFIFIHLWTSLAI